MPRAATRRLFLAAVLALVLFGVAAGVVIASQVRDAGVPVGLEEAIRTEPLVRVAEIPAAGGLPGRGVFAQRTSAGFICLWDVVSASSPGRQGGCNRVQDPFGGKAVFASLAYDGGPAIGDVKDARLIGLVSAQAARVQVLMSNGTRREVGLAKTTIGGETFRAFGYRFSQADLRKGVGPIAVVALDSDGAEIGRQPTGIGG